MRHAEDDAVLTAARQLLGHLGRVGRLPLTVRLWDGSSVPLATDPERAVVIDVAGPAVLGRFFAERRSTGCFASTYSVASPRPTATFWACSTVCSDSASSIARS